MGNQIHGVQFLLNWPKRIYFSNRMTLTVLSQWNWPFGCKFSSLHLFVLTYICENCFHNYYVRSWAIAKNVFCEVTVSFTFNFWPPESKEFILKSKWTSKPNSRKFYTGVLELCIHEKGTDKRTDGQPEHKKPSSHSYHWRQAVWFGDLTQKFLCSQPIL